MSLDDYITSGPTRLQSPNSANEWIPKDFPDDNFFLDGSFDPPLNLTADEERLFRSFGDAFDSARGSPTEAINERQVVFAEAQAAGLFKGGIRRAAFSMGDLQALQPPEATLPSRMPSSRPPLPSAGSSKPSRLESVPESKAMPVSAPLFGDDLELDSQVSNLSSGGIGDSAMDSLTFDQLSVDLAAGMPSSFDSHDMPLGLFGTEQPSASGSLSGMQPMIKAEPEENLGMSPLFSSRTQPMELSPDFPAVTSPPYDFPFPPGLNKPRSGLTKIEEGQAYSGRPSGSRVALGDSLRHQSMPMAPQSLPKASPPAGRDGKKELEREKEREQQRQRMLRRSQSAVELRTMPLGIPRNSSTGDLRKQPFTVELTNPEGQTYIAGRLSNEERAQKILRYRQKRHERNFKKRIKYMCRKTLADSRPRVRGRFARNDDSAAVMPHETKKALAEKARKEKKANAAAAAAAKVDSEQSAQWTREADLADPLDITLPDLDTQGEANFGDAFPSSNTFAFPSLPSGLVYTSSSLNDVSGQYRNS